VVFVGVVDGNEIASLPSLQPAIAVTKNNAEEDRMSRCGKLMRTFSLTGPSQSIALAAFRAPAIWVNTSVDAHSIRV
jgi:hypothetical protein